MNNSSLLISKISITLLRTDHKSSQHVEIEYILNTFSKSANNLSISDWGLEQERLAT